MTVEEIKDVLLDCANRHVKKNCTGCEYLDNGCQEKLVSVMGDEFRKMFGEEIKNGN